MRYLKLYICADSTQDSVLISQNPQHYQDMEILLNNRAAMEYYLNNEDYTKIQLARARNEDVSVLEIIESNTQIINEIRLIYEEADSYNYDSETESLIASIAHQCPQAGGSSVFVARALYSMNHPNEYYDDASACIALGYFRKSKIEKAEKNSITLSYFSINPNPAEDFINLKYYVSNVSTKIEFNLYNALQQKVKSINLPAELIEYQMKCNDLVNGVYFYTLKQGNEILGQGKISIIN